MYTAVCRRNDKPWHDLQNSHDLDEGPEIGVDVGDAEGGHMWLHVLHVEVGKHVEIT